MYDNILKQFVEIRKLRKDIAKLTAFIENVVTSDVAMHMKVNEDGSVTLIWED